MQHFLDLLAKSSQLIETYQKSQAKARYKKAEESLRNLRVAYKELSPVEQQAVLPLATLLADKLASNSNNETIKTETKKAAKPKTSAIDKVFTEAVTGVEQITLDFEAAPKTRLFAGDKTPEALLEFFGYDGFRPGQKEAVQAALDKRDSLIIMPTGGGKSLCYQLAGVATEDLTVIVTPLVALMRDQYQRLAVDGHPAVMLASGLPEEHNRDALDQVRDGTARIVFCAPERFASQAFNDALATRHIALFVVDEAHCVSEWGHDFRPDYLRLHVALNRLGRPPVMACTATATPQVAQEIAQRLDLRDPEIIQGGFDRPNLSFDVVSLSGTGSVEKKYQLLETGLHMAANRPAIVYCGTRKDVEEVSSRLQDSGLKAIGYHAGMISDKRTKAQALFMDGDADVVVATNAFGMGVDKADVRSVWHWAIPTSVEAYYQEAGRAGRDGNPSRAVLLAMRADLGRLISFNKKRAMTVPMVQEYLRRLEKVTKEGKALISNPETDQDRMSLAIAERAGALAIDPARGGKLQVTLLEDLNPRRALACCEVAQRRGWEAYQAIEKFASNHVLCRRQQLLDHFGDQRTPHPLGRCCDVCDKREWLPDPDNITIAGTRIRPASIKKQSSAKAKTRKIPAKTTAGALFPPSPLLDELVAWRKKTAGKKPAYQVAKNATLVEIAAKKPKTDAELEAIKGVGPTFMMRYGPTVLAFVKKHS